MDVVKHVKTYGMIDEIPNTLELMEWDFKNRIKKGPLFKGLFLVGFKCGPDTTQVAFCRFCVRFGKLTLLS